MLDLLTSKIAQPLEYEIQTIIKYVYRGLEASMYIFFVCPSVCLYVMPINFNKQLSVSVKNVFQIKIRVFLSSIYVATCNKISQMFIYIYFFRFFEDKEREILNEYLIVYTNKVSQFYKMLKNKYNKKKMFKVITFTGLWIR